MAPAAPNKQKDSEYDTNAMPAPRVEFPRSSPSNVGLPQQSVPQLNQINHSKHMN